MSSMRKRVFSLLMVLALVIGLAGSFASSALSASARAEVYSGDIPKYVFMFIGDGMSYPQIAATEMFLGKKKNLTDIVGGGGIDQLSFSKFPVAGAAQTFDSTSFIPDSASTATSLASGYKTLSGVINMDPSKKVKYTPITEKLAKKGYKIGIVSSVPLNHATPAAYYAKAPSRNDYYDIAKQLAASNFTYFAGGWFLDAAGKDGKSEHIDSVLANSGYRVVRSSYDIAYLGPDSGKVVALCPNPSVDGTSMPYEIDRSQGELSLADFVYTGINVLKNPNGFFLMVEGGKIDWANHANDGAASIQDTLAFADAVEVAVNFYNKYPKDTLIIVTGDHECGGMSIGFAATGYSTFFEKMDRVKVSYEVFDKFVIGPYKAKTTAQAARLSDLLPDIKEAFGLIAASDPDAAKNPGMVLTATEMAQIEAALKQSMIPSASRKYSDVEKIMYGTYEPLSVTLTHIVNNKSGIHFASYSHTGLPVPVFAMGPGQDLFRGFYDNTDVYRKMAAILKVE